MNYELSIRASPSEKQMLDQNLYAEQYQNDAAGNLGF